MARALSGIDETGLMSRHLAGDNAAFAELFQRLHQRLYTYCLKIVGDPEHAEDAMSELWERIILLRRHPSHISNPVGFLLKSARNICLNQIKSRRRTTHFSMLAESGHPQEERREMSEVEEEVLAAV